MDGSECGIENGAKPSHVSPSNRRNGAAKPPNSRTRTRRPDQQLYVPKAKRSEELTACHSEERICTCAVQSMPVVPLVDPVRIACDEEVSRKTSSDLNRKKGSSSKPKLTTNSYGSASSENKCDVGGSAADDVDGSAASTRAGQDEISVHVDTLLPALQTDSCRVRRGYDESTEHFVADPVVPGSKDLVSEVVGGVTTCTETVDSSGGLVDNLVRMADVLSVNADEHSSDEVLRNNDGGLLSEHVASFSTVESTRGAKVPCRLEAGVDDTVEHVPKNVGTTSEPVQQSAREKLPSVDSWDALYDETGECLDVPTLKQLTNAVGRVVIHAPQIDYWSFASNEPSISDDGHAHIVEIYGFPAEFKTEDLVTAFAQFKERGFDIKWVDDTHALGVFSSRTAAQEALSMRHPFIKTRPLSQGARESKKKAQKCAEFLQPYKSRPETSAFLARRLVAGALGLQVQVTKEQRDEDRRKLREAKERKQLAVKQKEAAWEGVIDNI